MDEENYFYSWPRTDFSLGSISPLMCVWLTSQDHVPIQKLLLSVHAASAKAIPLNLFGSNSVFGGKLQIIAMVRARFILHISGLKKMTG